MAARKTIKIDVISDFLCAWCYIGHIELERGIALARAAALPVDFAVQYHPFILNPSLADDAPLAKADFFARKMGPGRWQGTVALVQARAREEGLEFSFGGVVRQTTRAHRLMQRAYATGGQRAQLPLIKALFRAVYEREQDIGCARTLAALACSLGVGAFASEEEARAWIEGEDGAAEVREMSRDAARKGVTGVPFAVIDGRWAVSGCQAPECYLKVRARLSSSSASSPLPGLTG
ncbi:thioredoxin-like protein [Phellopilus nigrolimitatus]|nr:thioredoxin-like protein [Phellopilus nigrolimitatus]